MDSQYNNAKEKLKKFNQEHLLRFYEELEENKKQELLKQIENINFEEIEKLYSQTKQTAENEDIGKIELLPHVEKEKLSEKEKEYYREIGIKHIRKGYQVVKIYNID